MTTTATSNFPSSIVFSIAIFGIWLIVKMKDLCFLQIQIEWKEEIKEQLQKIKAEGSHMPQLEEDLIRRRREELR